MADQTTYWNDRYATKDTPWDSGKPSMELRRVLGERRIKPCDVLEIGCGTGTNAVDLARQGFRVTALDVSSLAIEQARKRSVEARVSVDFHVADLLAPISLKRTFPLVFDRGVYHGIRRDDLSRFLDTLGSVTAPGSLYLVLAGNANDPADPEKGPPRVHAHEICSELNPLFELVELREFIFSGIVIDGKPVSPLGWSGLFRRRASNGRDTRTNLDVR
jgi:methyl halide transferase